MAVLSRSAGSALFRRLDGIRGLGLRALGRRFHPCPSLGSVRKDLPLLYPRIATRATAILPRFSRRRRLRQPPRCIWDRSRSACRGDRALIANAGLASRSGRCRSNVQTSDAGDDDLDWSSRASEPVRSARRRSRTSVLNRSTDWRRGCALFRSSARADPCQAPAIMDGSCGLLSKQRSFSTLAHSRIFPSVREDFLFGKIGGLNPKKSFLTRAGANNRYNASGEIF